MKTTNQIAAAVVRASEELDAALAYISTGWAALNDEFLEFDAPQLVIGDGITRLNNARLELATALELYQSGQKLPAKLRQEPATE